MNVRLIDDQGHLWFLTAHDNTLSHELQQASAVTLLFQGAKTSEFMQINGQSKVSRDQTKIEALWEPLLKTWFTEGVHDPRIRVVEVIPRAVTTGTKSTVAWWQAPK